MYTTEDLAAILNVTPQTIRSRSEEYADYLSTSANPGKRRVRAYTDKDARTMLLINTMHESGAWIPDIHKALGEGKLPELPKPAEKSLGAKPESQITIESQITELQIALASEKGENRLLREQLATTQERLEKLLIENALLKAKGQG